MALRTAAPAVGKSRAKLAKRALEKKVMQHDCPLQKGVLSAHHLTTQNRIEKDVVGTLIKVKTKRFSPKFVLI